MSSRPSPAVLQALALVRAPRSARPGLDERLPEGMDLLLRIVGSDAEAMRFARESTGESSAALRDAAAFYIQQVMFATDSDSYRVLGLDLGASDEQLKSHHRWLTRWLHPDRNRDEWEAIYSERVNRAWQDLRNSERRLRYDQSRAGDPSTGAFLPRGPRTVPGRVIRPDGAEQSVDWRWLPRAIFGGLGVSAVAIVAVFYILRFASPSTQSAVVTEIEPATRFESSVARKPSVVSGTIAETKAVVESPGPAKISPDISPEVPQKTIAPRAESPPEKPVLSERSIASKVDVITTAPSRPPPAPQLVQKLEPSPVESPQKREPIAAAQAPELVRVVDSSPPHETAHVPPMTQREANRLLGQFSAVYAEGDLSGMRSMFTADASSPDGGLKEILDAYDGLFKRSSERVLQVRDVRWFANGEAFTIVANYETTMKKGRFSRSSSHGDLRLDLRQENDKWLIYRLQHRERSG